jgi:hypothetical protein
VQIKSEINKITTFGAFLSLDPNKIKLEILKLPLEFDDANHMRIVKQFLITAGIKSGWKMA